MARWVHRLSDLDTVARTATCQHCGPVDITLQSKGGGRKQWRCGEVVRASFRRRYQSRATRERYLEYHRTYMNAYNAAQPERLSRYNRKKLLKAHGLTEADFQRMVIDRQGKCDLCHEVPQKLFIDHDHVTLRIRGLLCLHCNCALGFLKDRPAVALRVPAYLASERGTLALSAPQSSSNDGPL